MRKRTALMVAGCLAVAFLAFELLTPNYVTSVREAKELTLEEDLTAMRQVLKQYVLDKHQRPQSLHDLVAAGYIKQIPADPMTGRTDTWVLEWSSERDAPGIVNLHSGSSSKSRKGTLYSEW